MLFLILHVSIFVFIIYIFSIVGMILFKSMAYGVLVKLIRGIGVFVLFIFRKAISFGH